MSLYWIPSTSMENTILVGDYCIGLKSVYGPQIPFTNIKFPILSTPKRGDIVIFKNAVFNGMSMIKRCVAVSGDSVEMRSKKLLVNGTASVYESLTKHIDKRVLDYRDSFEEIIVPRKGEQISFTTDNIHKFEIEKNLFVQLYGAEDIKIERVLVIDSTIVKNYKFENYNLPNITSMSLSESMVTYSELYDFLGMIKNDLEREDVKIRQTIHKQGVKVDNFKVFENCYFVMGDNRDASNDSRFWGFITDRNLVAMPLFVYYSYEDVVSDDLIYYSTENNSYRKRDVGVRWERIGMFLWR